MILETKLDFWLKHGLNVLFTGKHGVGKTSLIIAAFERGGLKWKYFSASTMDPWVDFIGVPRPTKGPEGQEYLELVRPKEFADDEVEGLFFDEFNRAPKKVRNAVMELIQFKSINGKKFKKLKVVWAAINPHDDKHVYDVEKLDPAQLDRFQIHFKMDYKCSEDYFKQEYGIEAGKAAIEWWNGLPDEDKNEVSPRRLDYALKIHKIGGDIRDVLPFTSNIGKLLSGLSIGPTKDYLEKFLHGNLSSEARYWLSVENNYVLAIDYIIKTEGWHKFFLPLLKAEKITALFPLHPNILKFAAENSELGNLKNTVINYYRSSLSDIKSVIESYVPSQSELAKDIAAIKRNLIALPKCGSAPLRTGNWINIFTPVMDPLKVKSGSTYERTSAYKFIEQKLPSTLTEEESLFTIDCIERLMHRSRPTTIGKWTKVWNLLNHCFEELSKTTNRTYAELAKDHKGAWRKGIRFRAMQMNKVQELLITIL